MRVRAVEPVHESERFTQDSMFRVLSPHGDAVLMATTATINLLPEHLDRAKARSPSPLQEDCEDYECYEDIPEVPEEFEDIPMYAGTPEKETDVKMVEDDCIQLLAFACKSNTLHVSDENFNVNKAMLESNLDGPECMHSSVGVKALREKLNQQIASVSPLCSSATPARVQMSSQRTPTATREVRSHMQCAAVKAPQERTPEVMDGEQVKNSGERFPSPPIRKQFEELDAEKSVDTSADGIGGLQMSSENSAEFGATEDERLEIVQEVDCCLQLSDAPSDSPEMQVVRPDDAYSEDRYAPMDAIPSESLKSMVIVFSEDDHDSKALTMNDHARAEYAAMTEICTARLPAPPQQVQPDQDDEQEVEYSNEEIQAIANVLLNPKHKAVAETPRYSTPCKINAHIRQALQEIHYSPTPRASSMLQQLRKKETRCRKVPTPQAPKGSILGLQPGRSLMPVSGLHCANLAALVTVAAAMSPHKKNNTQHSRRSKMPQGKGGQAANRAALAEMASSKSRKLALFHQPELSQADSQRQKSMWAGHVSKYGDKAKERFEEFEAIPAPLLVAIDDSMVDGSLVIDGLQDSIDGLQASLSSDEGDVEIADKVLGNLKNDESIYTSFTHDKDDDSDDEIFPEHAATQLMDHHVDQKIGRIHQTQVFPLASLCLVLLGVSIDFPLCLVSFQIHTKEQGAKKSAPVVAF